MWTSEKLAVTVWLLLVTVSRCIGITQARVVCFIDGSCNGAPTIINTRRECCVGNPNAVTFRIEGDDTCHVCVVFGFFQDTLSAPEQGPGYSVQAGYLKGTDEAQRNLVFNVQTEQGTATSSDFTLNTPNFRVLFRNTEPEEVSFTFRVDAVAQEPPETAVLRLEPSSSNLFRGFDFDNNVFFLNQLNLTIIDSDRVEIIFCVDDFRVSEPDLSVPVRVCKDIRIATPVTVRVTPLTLTQFRDTSGRPDPPGLAEDDPLSPIEANLEPADFNNSVITVTFEPDEAGQLVIDLPAFVPIVDDPINEANEQDFLVTLSIVSAINKASIDIAERQDAICRIIDDDDIRIGFVQPMYTFEEPSNIDGQLFVQQVRLAKEDNVRSEQTFRVVVITSTTTPNANIQPASISAVVDGMLRDNDYIISNPDEQSTVVDFPPDLQEIPFYIFLFPDDVTEGAEAFQASPAPQENTPNFLKPQINPQTLYRNTFIIIEDDDFAVVGFERNYTVNETVGTVEVCAVVTNPPQEEDLPFSIVLSVNTVVGKAGEQDYSPLSAVNLDVVFIFNRGTRRDCFGVTIIDDDVFENTKTFTIELVFDPFSPIPSGVILDPNMTSITILDDDEAVIGFIDPPYEVGESDGFVNLQVGVLSSGSLEREVAISLFTSDGTATDLGDYESVSDFLITFGPSLRSFNVPVNINSDGVYELTEYFSAGIVSLDGPIERLTVAPDEANVTIIDDDVLKFGFDPIIYTVTEDVAGGAVDLTISFISGDAGELEPVALVSTENGTAFGMPAVEFDFESIDSEQLVFSSTDRSRTFAVDINNDGFTELSEEFFGILDDVFLRRGVGRSQVILSAQERGRIILSPTRARVEITDDDLSVIGFLEEVYNVSESGGAVDFLVGVIMGELRVDAFVTFQTDNNTALAADDYAETTEELSFFGTDSFSMPVIIVNDNILEYEESFFGRLFPTMPLPAGVSLSPILATANIIDDDSITIGFGPDVYTVNEQDGNVTFTVRVIILSGELNRDVAVMFFTTDGGAGEPGDYTITTHVLTFSSKVRSLDVSVPIVDDDTVETVENFFGNLALVNADDASQVTLGPNMATASIIDNDGNTVECFTDGKCNGAPSITSTRRECCVGNPTGMAFRLRQGDETCHVCVVFGFWQGTLVAPEQDPAYSVQAGYLKGASDAQQNLVFNVQIELGTATMSDFTLITQKFRVLFHNPEPEKVSITFHVDAVAQEPPETAVLRLQSARPLDFNNNSFFLDQLSLTIIDSNRVQIFFTNDDYRVSEPDLFVPVRVAKYSHIATPVTVEVIPLTLTQFRDTSGRDVPQGLAEDDPLSPIEANLQDFVNSVIAVTFSPDEGLPHVNDLPAFVPIVDDNINEAYEQDFIVTLRIVSATNESRIDVYKQQDAICRIINDDDIRIGFEQRMYTFKEPLNEERGSFEQVFLAKEDNVRSEQTFQVVVTASTTTPNTIIQPASISEVIQNPNGTAMVIHKNDYTVDYSGSQSMVIEFHPNEQRIPFEFALFPDDVAEGAEAFQVSPAPQENTPNFLKPQINPQTLYRNTFIIIEDDDFAVVGFERNYTVNESVGMVQVCAVVTNPPQEEYLPFNIILSVNTVVGTAGEQDYSPLSAVSLDVALIFNRTTRRDCFDVTIIDDDVFENTEIFTIDLVFDVFTPKPTQVVLIPNVTIMTILDNDEAVIGFIDPPYEVGESDGFVNLPIGVLSSGPLEREIVISLSTSNGQTATDPGDYKGVSDFLITFGPSLRSFNVPVNITSDGVYELTEYFSAGIVSLDGSIERLTVAPDEAKVEISDDDAVVVGFEREQYTVSESDGSVEVCAVVTSRHPLTFPVILSANTVPGTADNRDFMKLVALRLNVALLLTNAIRKTCINVVIIDDALVEGSETFTVQLVFHPFFLGTGILLKPNVTSIAIEAGI